MPGWSNTRADIDSYPGCRPGGGHSLSRIRTPTRSGLFVCYRRVFPLHCASETHSTLQSAVSGSQRLTPEQSPSVVHWRSQVRVYGSQPSPALQLASVAHSCRHIPTRLSHTNEPSQFTSERHSSSQSPTQLRLSSQTKSWIVIGSPPKQTPTRHPGKHSPSSQYQSSGQSPHEVHDSVQIPVRESQRAVPSQSLSDSHSGRQRYSSRSHTCPRRQPSSDVHSRRQACVRRSHTGMSTHSGPNPQCRAPRQSVFVIHCGRHTSLSLSHTWLE